ncbi:hypothetical protein BCR41DRAFT_344380 [Lobosporangium transversale]|uniref:Uncharacterized protein n=1 Tax=Lobosporangium transversale TaxID=64571 RepID=A0A1Y2H374_9FUNG|nr:hypothetical protein BCR41DRAFT_344380 [Lobosporangium transversale]ORZ28986.1 hypothetical protein BCR41DRAFT_344380 [Lobosporangium transversale]|eukprot:XP_021886659.1 hypothetical protein BCR41DRAFT_344380 [Lobosporangium transversale]
MLNPTILASQHAQDQEEVHSHLMHPISHHHHLGTAARYTTELEQHHQNHLQIQQIQQLQLQQQQQLRMLQQLHQPHPQLLLQHHHSLVGLHGQQMNQNSQFTQELLPETYLQQQQLQNDQSEDGRGRPSETVAVESGFQRKRSLSVPLLSMGQQQQSQQQQQLSEQEQGPTVAAVANQLSGQTGKDDDGDQNMEADEDQDNDNNSNNNSNNNNRDNGDHNREYRHHDSSNTSIENVNASTVVSTTIVAPEASSVVVFNKLAISRETFLASLPRTVRHRMYASGPQNYPLYHHNNRQSNSSYTLRHHLHYNPFTYRKFPPYQYWGASAQRDYHLATIGVSVFNRTNAQLLSHGTGSTTASVGALNDSGSTRPGLSPGVGDMVLRSSVTNGGINKTMYRSRLPVHLRHITSRMNRRAVICTDAYENGSAGGEREGERGGGGGGGGTEEESNVNRNIAGNQNSQRDLGMEDSVNGILLSSLSIHEGSPQSTSTPLFAASVTENSDGSGDGFNSSSNPVLYSSQSLSSLESDRRKLSDWKRVSALSVDMSDTQDNHIERGVTMRHRTGDDLLMGSRLSSGLRLSSVNGSSTGLKSNSSSGKHWMSQRNGLANVLQSAGGTGSKSGAASTVDRLVEEMNKWSV